MRRICRRASRRDLSVLASSVSATAVSHDPNDRKGFLNNRTPTGSAPGARPRRRAFSKAAVASTMR